MLRINTHMGCYGALHNALPIIIALHKGAGRGPGRSHALLPAMSKVSRGVCQEHSLPQADRFGSVADLTAPRRVGGATIRHAKGDIPASESSLRRSII
jgi:hypothetical protein